MEAHKKDETALEKVAPKTTALARDEWTSEQIELIKATVAKGSTNDELKLFLYTAHRMGLDPLAKQIHAVKRWSKEDKRKVMAIQVGIDGLRLVADRTGKYAPGQTTTYEERGGDLISATAYVKKLANGTWHEFGETAYYQEYVARKQDGSPNRMWTQFPKVMLAKCAEARALRRAFPAELSGVYTNEEMDQAGEIIDVTPKPTPQEKADEETKAQEWTVPIWKTLENSGHPDPNGVWNRVRARVKTNNEIKTEIAYQKKFKEEVLTEIDDWRASEDEPQKMFVSHEQIDHLIETAKTATDFLNTAKQVFDWCKGQLKNFNLEKFEQITVDEYEGLLQILDTRTGDKTYDPQVEVGDE